MIADLRLKDQGEDWNAILKDIGMLNWDADEASREWKSAKVSGHDVLVLGDGARILLFRYQPSPRHLIITWSRQSLEAYFESESAKLTSSVDFSSHWATMQPYDDLRLWVRGHDLLKAMADAPDELPDFAFAVPEVLSYGLRFDQASLQSSIRLQMNPTRESWLEGIGRQPLSSDRLRLVPAEAFAAGLVRLDVKELWSLWTEVDRPLDDSGKGVESTLHDLERLTGLSLEADVIDQMNGELLYYAVPPRGDATIPGLVVGVGAVDSARLLSSLKTLLAAKWGAPENPNREVAFEGHTLSVHELASREDHPFLELCLVSSGGFVWISIDVPSMKDALRHLAAKGNSLWTRERFAALRKAAKVPDRVHALSYLDLPKIVEHFGAAIQSGSIDPVAPERISRHLSPGLTWAARDEHLLELKSTTSLGEEWLLPILPFVATRVIDLSKNGGLEAAKRRQTENVIRMLDQAVKMHALDNNNRKPEKLQDLVTPNEWSETGYLESEEIPLDAWGNPFVYLPSDSPTGDDYDIISFGADGREGGEGDNADIKLSEMRQRR